MNAILRSSTHPEYGSIAVTLPIPDEHYDAIIGNLQILGMGGITERDCHIERLDGNPPLLQCLEGQTVNIDEIDFLARQTEEFSESDAAAYQAEAYKRGFTGIGELINLSGVVNLRNAAEGKELLNLYRGGNLPGAYARNGVMELYIHANGRSRDTADFTYLKLPMSDLKLERMLQRGGIADTGDINIAVAATGCSFQHLPDNFDHTSPQEFNRLAHALAPLLNEDKEKLIAVKEFARAKEANQITALAEHLDRFEWMPNAKTLMGYKRLSDRWRQGGIGAATSMGFVAYYGSQPLEDLLREPQKEELTMEMGGQT